MQLMMRLSVMTLMVGAMAGQSRADLSLQFSSADNVSDSVAFSAGFAFTTTTTVQVTALDLCSPLVVGGNEVRLYDGSQNVLASAIVQTTDPTESTGNGSDNVRTYNVHTLDTPAILAANTTYYIVGDYDPELTRDGELAQFTLGNATNLNSVAGINYNRGVFVLFGHGNPTTDQSGGVYNQAFFGVNFDLASAVATPEPSTLVLAVCGVPALLAMGYRRYRHTRVA